MKAKFQKFSFRFLGTLQLRRTVVPRRNQKKSGRRKIKLRIRNRSGDAVTDERWCGKSGQKQGFPGTGQRCTDYESVTPCFLGRRSELQKQEIPESNVFLNEIASQKSTVTHNKSNRRTRPSDLLRSARPAKYFGTTLYW